MIMITLMILVTMRIMMCDDYEDDFDNDLITTYHEKADGCDNDYDGCSNDGN